jgi:virginiamycin B lyase
LEKRNLLSFAQFSLPTPEAEPLGITAGPDGALWFTEATADQIGRLVPQGARVIAITEFGGLKPGSRPERITAGPDGALWFTEPGTNQIGRITTDGVVTEYAIPTAGSDPRGITPGPDGAVWFTERRTDMIGRVTSDGSITEYSAPWDRLGPSGFQGIAAGPDGALYFTEQVVHAIGRFSPKGGFYQYRLPSGGDPLAITVGSDGALWFTEQDFTQIGRLGLDGKIKEFGPHILNSFYGDITAGPDGALWFVVNNTIGPVQLGRITPDGEETFVDVSAPFGLGGIATGPDGNIWFTETGGNAIGQWTLDPEGSISDAAGRSPSFEVGTPAPEPDPWMVTPRGEFGVESLPSRSVELFFSSLRQHHGLEELAYLPQSAPGEESTSEWLPGS